MNTYIIGEADRIHVKGEYYKGEKLLRCSNCGQRGISTFDMHCCGCGFLLNRIDSIDGEMRFTHTPPIIEVDELPEFSNCMEVNYVAESEEYSEIKNEVKDLSKRVETLEKQTKEDKEEQLKKLKAELDYAKFRCTL